MKRDFSIIPSTGLPQARIEPLIEEEYQKKPITDSYAEIAPAKLTCLPKSKKSLFLADFN